jgi:hypothetical protein
MEPRATLGLVSAPPKDLLLVGPATSSESVLVLREREDRVEVGELRALREGRPISGDGGELVKLRRRPEHERLFDVDVVAELPTRAAAPADRSGPPQVATDAYRENWELIFGDGERRRPN